MQTTADLPQPTEYLPSGQRELLLVVAVECAGDFGLARLSMADVARRAGVSRQTLYRYFTSKEELLAAAVAAEAELLLSECLSAALSERTPRAGLQAALTRGLEAPRQHPLLTRLLRTEPESLLPLLTSHQGPVMARVRQVLDVLLADDGVALSRRPAVVDLLARLVLSHAICPSGDPAQHAALWTELALSTPAVRA